MEITKSPINLNNIGRLLNLGDNSIMIIISRGDSRPYLIINVYAQHTKYINIDILLNTVSETLLEQLPLEEIAKIRNTDVEFRLTLSNCNIGSAQYDKISQTIKCALFETISNIKGYGFNPSGARKLEKFFEKEQPYKALDETTTVNMGEFVE